jgi:cytochrome P450
MDKDVLEQGVFFALQRAKYRANPYPLYHRLRAEAPFHWDFVLGGWFLTRYDDVRAALVDPRLSTKNFLFDVSQLPTALRKTWHHSDASRRQMFFITTRPSMIDCDGR